MDLEIYDAEEVIPSRHIGPYHDFKNNHWEGDSSPDLAILKKGTAHC
jgi:hypothetical protein